MPEDDLERWLNTIRKMAKTRIVVDYRPPSEREEWSMRDQWVAVHSACSEARAAGALLVSDDPHAVVASALSRYASAVTAERYAHHVARIQTLRSGRA